MKYDLCNQSDVNEFMKEVLDYISKGCTAYLKNNKDLDNIHDKLIKCRVNILKGENYEIRHSMITSLFFMFSCWIPGVLISSYINFILKTVIQDSYESNSKFLDWVTYIYYFRPDIDLEDIIKITMTYNELMQKTVDTSIFPIINRLCKRIDYKKLRAIYIPKALSTKEIILSDSEINTIYREIIESKEYKFFESNLEVDAYGYYGSNILKLFFFDNDCISRSLNKDFIAGKLNSGAAYRLITKLYNLVELTSLNLDVSIGNTYYQDNPYPCRDRIVFDFLDLRGCNGKPHSAKGFTIEINVNNIRKEKKWHSNELIGINNS
jgi:hypothetical protein